MQSGFAGQNIVAPQQFFNVLGFPIPLGFPSDLSSHPCQQDLQSGYGQCSDATLEWRELAWQTGPRTDVSPFKESVEDLLGTVDNRILDEVPISSFCANPTAVNRQLRRCR